MSAFQDGDILLCKSKGFTSWLIRWGTGSVYSHAAVVTAAKLSLIIEAVPKGGVRAMYLKNMDTEFDAYRVKSGHSFDSLGVAVYMITVLARKYDFKSVLRLGWGIFLRRLKLVQLFGLKLAKMKAAADKLQEDQDFFCSELVYKAFRFGGNLDIVPQIGDAETTSPGDIARSPIIEKITLPVPTLQA